MESTTVLIQELSKAREAGKAALSALMVILALHNNRCHCRQSGAVRDRCPGVDEAHDAIIQLREMLK